MALPSNTEILKVLKSIDKKKNTVNDRTLRVPSKDAPIEVRSKFKISQKLLEFKLSKDYTIDDMSKLLKTDRSNISKILNGHIENVSMDKLLSYLQIVIIASERKQLEKDFFKNTEEYFDFDDIKFG
jgi:hypothetical protein